MTRRPLPALAVLLALVVPTGRALGQPVGASGTLPRHAIRVSVAGDHELFRERWNDGVREPLGGGFTVSALDGQHLSALNALGANIKLFLPFSPTLTPYTPTLGGTRLDLRQRVFTTRFGVEYGLTDWLTVGVEIPMVRTRSEAQLRGGGGAAPTAGANPYYTGTGVPAANRAIVDAYLAAATNLETRRDDCTADSNAHPECDEILGVPTIVQDLIDDAQLFAATMAATYGAQGLADGLPYVPLAGSTWEDGLATFLASLRSGFVGFGVTDITAGTGLPMAAQAPLTATQLAAMVDTIFGARPMTRTARQSLGDVDLGVRARLFSRPTRNGATGFALGGVGIRQTVGLTYRLGNGEFDAPDNFIDVGTGVSATAIALRSFTDLALNDRLWATVTVGVVQGAAYDRTLRLPSAYGVEWLEPWRTTAVRVTPGRLLELTVAPRWQLNDYLAVGGAWEFRLKAPDESSPGDIYEADPHGNLVARSTKWLDAASEWAEQRLVLSLSYSTVRAPSSVAGMPFEIGYRHEQSVESSGGIIPRRFTDRVQLRFYPRFLAR